MVGAFSFNLNSILISATPEFVRSLSLLVKFTTNKGYFDLNLAGEIVLFGCKKPSNEGKNLTKS